MLFALTLEAAELPLADDGRARAVIVIGGEAKTQLSAGTRGIVIATPHSGLVPALGLRQRTTPSADELGMPQFSQAPAAKWREVLKELNAKLEAAAH
jgi:hypothetical protein